MQTNGTCYSFLSRQVWDKNDLLYEGQHGFRAGNSCESQIITVCQDIADSLDNGDRMDAVIIDFSKAFDLVPHGRLFTKIANSLVDSRVVVWIREFLLFNRIHPVVLYQYNIIIARL